MLAVCASASALDEVVLKNGRKYLGTIVVNTPDIVVLSIDEGTVTFPRSAVVSPPYTGPLRPPGREGADGGSDAAGAPDHPLPSIETALAWLAEFPEVTFVRQVPVMVTDRGRWRYLPAVSFWVEGFFQLTFFGDPKRPAAVETSLHHPSPDAWEQKRLLLEYIFGLAPGLAVDDRFEDLNIRGDSFAVGDLWFSITGPQSTETPDRWSVLLMHDRTLARSRATISELESISETIDKAVIDPAKPRSWQEGSWTPDEIDWVRTAPPPDRPSSETGSDQPAETGLSRSWTGLGGERVFVRAFARTQDRYHRSADNWLEAPAAIEAD